MKLFLKKCLTKFVERDKFNIVVATSSNRENNNDEEFGKKILLDENNQKCYIDKVAALRNAMR
jgi:hypothetical protein